MARQHETRAEKARDNMTREFFGDVPKSRFMPSLDAPQSPEEPLSLNEWLEAMDPDEFYMDSADMLLCYSPGPDPSERQMREAAEQLREWLAFAADFLAGS
jgi:hypothetical protein